MPRRLQTTSDPWVVTDAIYHQNKLSLICLHHAGGDANIFQPWLEFLPSWIRLVAINLPGRSTLFTQQPYTDLNQLLPDLAARIKPWMNNNYVLFGHSLGALLAFELARCGNIYHYQQPKHLFLAGRESPRLPEDKMDHLLPDEEFIQVLRDKEGTPEEILKNHELMQLLLPIIRADFQVAETYRYQSENLLNCPISVFSGTEEEPSDDEFIAWKDETTGDFEFKRLPGGHFFVQTQFKFIIDLIVKSLQI